MRGLFSFWFTLIIYNGLLSIGESAANQSPIQRRFSVGLPPFVAFSTIQRLACIDALRAMFILFSFAIRLWWCSPDR
jgi:hypothetical protein